MINSKKRVTIDDVARFVGVSRQTVSRAINGKQDINLNTRARVMDAIEQLGFRPSRLAQGMASRRTQTVGLVVGDITNPAHAEVARGLQDVAQNHNYNIFLRNSDRDPTVELESLYSLASEGVDGIVILDCALDEGTLKQFADEYHPLILIHRHFEHPHVATIRTDVTRAIQSVVEYLIGCGHHAIGLLSRQGAFADIRHVRGYQHALALHGNQAPDHWIIQTPLTLQGGYQGTRHLLTNYPELTALITYNDSMAIGALRACVELNRSVPIDCAIFGFDDISLSSMVTPTLSTVRYNKYDLGKFSMQRLLEMIDQPNIRFAPEILDIELVIRESTRLD